MMQQQSVPTSDVPGEIAPHLRLPREKLDPNAKRVWIIGDVFTFLVFGAIVFGIAAVVRWLLEAHWGWVAGATGIVVLLGLLWTVLTPPIRYNQWRFEIREDEVDLLHGIVVKTRQIVPMSRIQHVDTVRGPIQRRYGLASVVFYTAAGSMTIPELSDERAASVRDQIATLAKVHDDL
jgi:membrane protein YdbS with pleckstrin-like domain